MHLALIMDGNRRWATGKGIIKILGHSKWADRIEPTLKLCLKEEIEYVSFWALAKRNIEERSPEELNHIYSLIIDQFPEMLPKLQRESIRFEVLWDENLLPENVREALHVMKEWTKDGTKLTFILAIGYGWQDEIVRWVKNYIQKNIDSLTPEKISSLLENLDENSFREYLDCGRFPNPDLIVRTWWDIRHSGYWLYSSEYSEYYFTPKLWPEFDEAEFYRALGSLKNAKRNFGK